MLAFNQSGSGIPLVFLHAFPLSAQMWDVNRPALSKNFHFITIDFPGFGASPLSGGTCTMESMAQQVVEVLDRLKLDKKIVVAGLSMGGYVTLQLLRLIPNRLRAIALLSTRSAADTPEGREKRFKMIEGVEREGLKFLADRMIPTLFGKSYLEARGPIIDDVRRKIESSNAQAVGAALRGMAERPDTTALLPAVKVPALVVSGEEDVVIPSSEMEAMSKKIPNSEFHQLPNAGHLLNLEHPDPFQNLVLHFLKRRVL